MAPMSGRKAPRVMVVALTPTLLARRGAGGAAPDRGSDDAAGASPVEVGSELPTSPSCSVADGPAAAVESPLAPSTGAVSPGPSAEPPKADVDVEPVSWSPT